MILAHGIGTRVDLPVPVFLAAIGAATAVVVSFVALGALWKKPLLDGEHAGRPVPGLLQRLADSVALRRTAQVITLAIALFVYSAALFGTQTARNISPWAFFVTFWVGLVPASLLLGPVWRYLNPLRAVHAGLAIALGISVDGRRALPRWVSYWPAAISLLGFAWFELVYPYRDVPMNIGWFLLVYAVVQVSAALVFGRDWFARGDGFEVYSTLLGSMAVIGRRRSDGRVVLRNPLEGLDSVVALPGLAAVVIVLVGSTSYDGLTRTSWFVDNVPAGTGAHTAALLLAISLIWLVYFAGTWLVTVTPTPSGQIIEPAAFAHTIVPVAAAYAIAHYFSLLMFDGQETFILTSDPYGTGANYFGWANHPVNYLLVSTRAIAIVQVVAIVIGHIVAVTSAHDRAVRLFPYRQAVRTQIPLLVAMVCLTLIAIGLVLSG